MHAGKPSEEHGPLEYPDSDESDYEYDTTAAISPAGLSTPPDVNESGNSTPYVKIEMPSKF